MSTLTPSALTAAAAPDEALHNAGPHRRRRARHGKQVVMWLSSDGVRPALCGYRDAIRDGQESPVKPVQEPFSY